MTRTVLVTGGSSGIGFAIAERFAADRVFLTGRRPEPLERAAAKLGATAIVADGTDPAQLTAALEQLPDRIDVLINNAGGNTDFDRPSGGDLATIAANWRANLDANLLSAVLTTAAVADRLAAGGAVVSIGSIAAEKAAGSYGAAKAALAQWNIDLAAELGPRGITCNVISCGYIEDTDFFRGRLSARRRETLIGQTMTGRPGNPAEVADTAYFLASPGARQLTAQVLHVNGGAHVTR